MKKTEELVVITKTYDLILWSCNHTSRFPRQHRFVLGERLERSLYDLLELLIQAKYQRIAESGLAAERSIPVVAPFADVAVDVEQTPAIGEFAAGEFRSTRPIDHVPVQQRLLITVTERGYGACPAGVFPLGLGRQAVTVGLRNQPPRLVTGGQTILTRRVKGKDAQG